jgi:predicted nucleic acid-binding protein
LFVDETASEGRKSLLKEDSRVMTWWASRVECASAFSRFLREGSLDEEGLTRAVGKLDVFYETCMEIQPTEELRKRAIRLLRVHPLHATDAFQLAAALLAARENPESIAFVSSDDRLKSAAHREGFVVA